MLCQCSVRGEDKQLAKPRQGADQIYGKCFTHVVQGQIVIKAGKWQHQDCEPGVGGVVVFARCYLIICVQQVGVDWYGNVAK